MGAGEFEVARFRSHTAAAVNPNPGQTVGAHRLNRAEYQNSVRALLDVSLDVTSLLPGDDSGEGGFDNMADVLTVSPALLDQYLSVATKIAREAVGSRNPRPLVETYSVPALYAQDDRMSDDLPAGSRGGLQIRHTFPAHGEYGITIRLQRQGLPGDRVRGLAERTELDVRLDGARVKTFVVGGAPQNLKPLGEFDPYDEDNGLSVRVPVTAGLAMNPSSNWFLASSVYSRAGLTTVVLPS